MDDKGQRLGLSPRQEEQVKLMLQFFFEAKVMPYIDVRHAENKAENAKTREEITDLRLLAAKYNGIAVGVAFLLGFIVVILNHYWK